LVNIKINLENHRYSNSKNRVTTTIVFDENMWTVYMCTCLVVGKVHLYK